MLDRFSVPKALLDQVYAHCEAGYPEEACGILTGPENGPPSRVFPCTNLQNQLHADDPKAHPRDARTAYRIDPKDLFAITRDIRQSGQVFQAIFHSHADVGAYFSDEDQRQAAPAMRLSRKAFLAGEGLTGAQLDRLIENGLVTVSEGEISAHMPSYPELVYLVVDVTRGRARGVRGFFWDPSVRRYEEIAVAIQAEGDRE